MFVYVTVAMLKSPKDEAFAGWINMSCLLADFGFMINLLSMIPVGMMDVMWGISTEQFADSIGLVARAVPWHIKG